MSMEDGVCTAFDNDTIKARLRAAMAEEGISWQALCASAGVASDVAQRAVEAGTDGLPQALPVFQRLSIALGRGPDWLISGSSGPESSFRETLQERVRQLVWLYVYKAPLPATEGDRLMKHYEKVFKSLTCATPQAAFRRGLPRTIRDVAYAYERMNTSGE